MKTLEEHNALVSEYIEAARNGKPKAGVKCDKCGTEMVYSSNIVYDSYPSSRSVECLSCGETGGKLGG